MIPKIVLFAAACAATFSAEPAFGQFDVGNGFTSSGDACLCSGGSWSGGGYAPPGDVAGNGYASKATFVGNGMAVMGNSFGNGYSSMSNGNTPQGSVRATRRSSRQTRGSRMKNG
jgi:hypothetical protein